MVNRRVATANAKIAETLCSCAVCTEALTRFQGQSRLVERAALVGQQAAAVGSAEVTGPIGSQLQSIASAAQADGLMVGTRRQKENRRKKESRRRKKETPLGEGQHEEVVQHSGRSCQEDEEAVVVCRGVVGDGRSSSTVSQKMFAIRLYLAVHQKIRYKRMSSQTLSFLSAVSGQQTREGGSQQTPNSSRWGRKSLQLRSNKNWVTSPSVKLIFMDLQSLSQSPK